VRGPRTLKGRLALSATIVAGAAVLLLTGVFALLLDRRLDAEAANVLRSRADAARATVAVRPDGSLEVGDDDHAAALETGIWIYEGRTAVERPPGGQALQETADELAGTAGKHLRRVKNPSAAFLSLAIRQGSRQVGTVVAAVSLEPYQRSARLTAAATVGLGATLVALVFLLSRSVAARALRPVAEMTQQAGEWSATDTSGRFGDSDRPGELQALAGTLDAVLDRLSAVLRREQQLSAEISHELRTPLAGIIAEAELFAARPRTTGQAVQAMDSVADGARRMERILDTLLAAARADASRERGRCDPLAVARHLELVVEAAGPVPFVGAEEEVVERVLAPLLENAERYSDQVRLRVSATAHSVQLEVLDEGPGVPAGAEEQVFDPGHRQRSDDGHPGAGLGLALSRRLARSVGGDVTCTAGPGGRFVVTLPRA
jgi:two-component system heavy metal sensor histidine kinase CusS